MSILLHTYKGQRARFLLSSSNLVGRHWRCDLSFDAEIVPLYWLEIRWWDSFWAWRVLSAQDQTKGTGMLLHNNWRKWKQGKTITLGGDLVLELSSGEAPVLLLENTKTKARRTIDDMNGLVEYAHNGVCLASEEEEKVYTDGEMIIVQDEIFQVHVPQSWSTSRDSEMDIVHEDLLLDIDIASLKATFTQGNHDCTIHGEPVRLLCVYAQFKKDHPEQFFCSEEIFAEWVSLGGTSTSPLERLNWERAKIKNKLSTKKAKNIEKLFTRKKSKKKWVFQLVIPEENITLI